MSENLYLVRSICAAWERGDYSSVDWADSDIEYEHVGGPAPGKWTGVSGMAEGWRSVIDVTAGHCVTVDDYRELGDDRVLVLFHLSGHGKTSGLDLGQMQASVASLFHLRRRKVKRLVNYLDPDRALADLGLEE
ncbi:MAG TPA: hypothetical protein VLZ06_11630 [Solirubrobacteraceae bacterium]|nr:hypothetical protein [Solirubrobacteraceae bacterium]